MISATQIQELIENDGYPAMFEMYERETPLYPQVAEVVSVGDAGAPLYGDKGAVFQNVDRFQPIEDGADPEDSTLDKGWTWQAAIKRYSRRIRIPATVLSPSRDRERAVVVPRTVPSVNSALSSAKVEKSTPAPNLL